MRKHVYRILVCLFAVVAALGCAQQHGSITASNGRAPKNVILIIGDGMGPEQVGLLLAYARQAPESVLVDRKTALDQIMDGGVMGISMTYPDNALVVDSAASGTQLASGKFAGSEMIGSDKDGNPVETVLEIAKKSGKATGLVSDTRLTHATPAAFAAHQPHRDLENEIAAQMIEIGPDVMLSGGLRHFIPQEANDKASDVYKALAELTGGAVTIKSKRKDSRDLLSEAQQQGYTLAFDRRQMAAAEGKLLGLFAYSALPWALEMKPSLNDPGRTMPTLKEMSAKALDLLSQNDRGFFLMIESGLIDWAAHYNDTGTMLHELLRFNETLAYVLDWAGKRDDTLVVVTADHDTGGFSFSYSAGPLPEAKTLPGTLFQNREFKPEYNFGDPAVLDRIYNQKLTYSDIFYDRFDGLPKDQQTPTKLAEIVNENTEFKITELQAARILATEENPYYVEGHGYLGSKSVPKIGAGGAFFVYQTDDNRQNILAREVGAAQQVVWSTGTHTSTPVLVFAKGPGASAAPYGSVLHHTQLGGFTIDAVSDR